LRTVENCRSSNRYPNWY